MRIRNPFMTDYIMQEIDLCFNPRDIKDRLLKIHQKFENKSYQRLIFIIDRRNPNVFDSDIESEMYSVNNKDWNDRIYCNKAKKQCNNDNRI